MNELVSIIIPVYNGEKYLEECIESIRNQTYEDLEIIIVNDGSTDNSLNIIKKIQEQDDRIVIIDKENEGVSVGRNTGLKKTTSDFIMFVDCDDTLEKDAIENFMEKMDDNVDIVISNVFCNTDGNITKAPCVYSEDNIFEADKKRELIESIFYVISTYTFPEVSSLQITINKNIQQSEIIFLVYFDLLQQVVFHEMPKIHY